MKDRKIPRSLIGNLIKFMLISLLIVAPLSSYGWFAGNKVLQHTDMDMSLRSDDSIASYKLYRYDNQTANRGILVGEKTVSDETESVLSLEMNEYDTIFTKRNRYTPAFIRIELIKVDSTPESGTVNVTLTKKDFDTVTVEGKEYDCISQVVRFTAVVDHTFNTSHTFSSLTGVDPISPAGIDAMEDDNADPSLSTKHHLFYTYVDEKLYSGIKHACTRVNNKVTPKIDNTVVSDDSNVFFSAIKAEKDTDGSIEGYDLTATDTITLSATYSASDWTTVTTEDGDQQILNLYVYLTYDDGLIECYKVNNNMNILSIGEDRVTFKNNLDHIKISFETGD